MKENIHKGVAKAHFKIAEEYDRSFREETEEERKKINRIVAAQNYFYSAINAIESIFAKLQQHSFSHENRYRKVIENQNLFSDEIFNLFKKVDRDERNKVAYRGKNGQMYEDIKKLAKLLNEAI